MLRQLCPIQTISPLSLGLRFPLLIKEAEDIKRFVWKSIICRLGIPKVIISDNGKLFDNAIFRDADLGIENLFASVAHPQANGQIEVTNRTIVQALKTRLGEAKGLRAEELPGTFWAYRTMQPEKVRSAWHTAQKRSFL